MPEIIAQLILLLGAALIFASIAEKLRQPAIVGYMLAGMLLGPNMLGHSLGIEFNSVQSIAGLGIILLMFSIGLEYNFERLKKLGLKALGAGVAQILLTATCVAICAGLLGRFGVGDKGTPLAFGIVLGLAVAMSSTAVVLPVLQRLKLADSPFGRFALGVLLVQDLAVIPSVILVAALVQGVQNGDSISALGVITGTAKGLGVTLGLAFAWWVASRWIWPRIIHATGQHRELGALLAVVAALGSAWCAEQVGLSASLGAFIAAVFLGESKAAPRIRADLSTMRNAFMALFFASIGMLADPGFIASNPLRILIITLLVVCLKIPCAFIVAKIFGLRLRHAVAAGFCLGQIGLFSYVLVESGYKGGIVHQDIFQGIVAATALLLLATPYWCKLGPWAGARVERFARRKGWLGAEDLTVTDSPDLRGHIIVVGYGPAGQAVIHKAIECGMSVLLIDRNPNNVLKAQAANIQAQLGDTAKPETLLKAAIQQASTLVITIPELSASATTVREAKRLAPDIPVFARARFAFHIPELKAAGATTIINEEESAGEDLAKAAVRLA